MRRLLRDEWYNKEQSDGRLGWEGDEVEYPHLTMNQYVTLKIGEVRLDSEVTSCEIETHLRNSLSIMTENYVLHKEYETVQYDALHGKDKFQFHRFHR